MHVYFTSKKSGTYFCAISTLRIQIKFNALTAIALISSFTELTFGKI